MSKSFPVLFKNLRGVSPPPPQGGLFAAYLEKILEKSLRTGDSFISSYALLISRPLHDTQSTIQYAASKFIKTAYSTAKMSIILNIIQPTMQCEEFNLDN